MIGFASLCHQHAFWSSSSHVYTRTLRMVQSDHPVSKQPEPWGPVLFIPFQKTSCCVLGTMWIRNQAPGKHSHCYCRNNLGNVLRPEQAQRNSMSLRWVWEQISGACQTWSWNPASASRSTICLLCVLLGVISWALMPLKTHTHKCQYKSLADLASTEVWCINNHDKWWQS